MTLKRAARLVILFLVAACSWASPLAPGVKAVEEIRGKKFLREVENVTIDRSDLSRYLTSQMERSTPYSIEDWGTVLRALQLVDEEPPKLLPKLLGLYEAQVLAFYDPHSHTYYSIRQLPKFPEEVTRVADPKLLEETVMVHELTHALQDQYFELGSREKVLMRDTDANLAYHAVLEGEAVLVMIAHMLAKASVDFDEAARDESMSGMLTSAAQADSMIDPATPRYFAELLKFPYLQGLEFVLEVYRRGGWPAVDRLHANPPRSTREILHPEEYFARRNPPPAFDETKPGDAIAAEHLGEFHWRFLVGAESARGLVSDRAVVFRDGRVTIDTAWEKPERASAFAVALEALLAKRGLKGATVVREESRVRAEYVTR